MKNTQFENKKNKETNKQRKWSKEKNQFSRISSFLYEINDVLPFFTMLTFLENGKRHWMLKVTKIVFTFRDARHYFLAYLFKKYLSQVVIFS